MKKFFIFLGAVGLLFFVTSPLWAGGIVNKQNFSAEYLRTFSRNAATDAADAAVFNPAGVMKMENDIYVNLGIFYAAKDYSNTVPGLGELDSDIPSIIPGFFALYKQDQWAGFFAFTIPGGGGKVDYKDGNATTAAIAGGIIAGAPPGVFTGINSMNLKGNSAYYGYNFGSAYAINDMISVSAGLRYVDAFKEADGSVNLITALPINSTFNVDFEQTANGWGGFLGVNIAPSDELNIGVRFETATKLDFESDVKEDTAGVLPALGFADGTKQREDLPGLIGLGVAYKVTPNLKVDLSYTYYLEKSAKWEGRLKDAGDSYDLAIAAEFAFTPQLRASLGYMLTNTGVSADDMLPEAPELDANTICGGIAWDPIENMTLNFAVLNSFYDSATTSSGVKYEKSIFGFGIGVEWKFM